MKPTVTACAVLYDCHELIGELVESLRRQTHPPDRWIFCLNDDDPATRAFVDAMPERPLVIGRPDNPGFAGGVNACLQVATTSHVLIVNPDVALAPDYVSVCLDRLERTPQAAGIGGLLTREEQTGECVDTAGLVASPWWRIVDRGAGSTDPQAFTEPEEVLGVCGAAALFSLDALRDVAVDGEILDEDFWMYKEDQDLCLRLREAGYTLLYEPRARGRHRRGWAPHRRASVPGELRVHSLKNRYLLIAKHWNWREHWWTLPFVAGFEAFVFCGLAVREPTTMRGYLLALKFLPRALRKRKVFGARLGPSRHAGLVTTLEGIA